MRQKLARFMYGRNGVDALYRFGSYSGIIILFVSMFLSGVLQSVILFLALVIIVFTYYRVFSKNLSARRAENAKYLRFKQRLKDELKLRRDMWKQRKEYKFFKCSSCKAVLRVPKGKGKIRIVCRKCGTAFEKKT